MALYSIGDTHLSFAKDKPMDIFGDRWKNHSQKLLDGFEDVCDDDVTVICGDISWGMGLAETLEDFKFIDALPGRKIILKGNHDYWWSTANKTYRYFETNGINTIDILFNNFYTYKDIAICGTKGWFYEEETGSEHDAKIMRREIMRLECSLNAAGDRDKIVFLHYPPIYRNYRCEEIIALLKKHGVRLCCYGHIHGKGRSTAATGWIDGIRYELVSADHLNFKPLHIRD